MSSRPRSSPDIRVPGLAARRNWNLPNLLTYGRVAAVPLVVAFLFWPADPWARWSALAIYAAAAITDFFDGYLARAWSQQSSLGRMLDPIADKLLALGFLIAGPAGDAVFPYATQIGIWLLWIAAILTFYTGWDYMKASYDHVADE